MKKFLLMAALFGVFTVNAQDKKAEEVMKVNTEKHDFGKIKQSVPTTTFFEITNITDQPLVIENVTAGCGCTTPKWSKEPIMAGGKTKIEVGYNAAAMNHFEKDVFVKVAGVTQPKVLKITGEVLDAAAYEAYVKGGKTEKKAEPAKVQNGTKSTSVKKTMTKSGK